MVVSLCVAGLGARIHRTRGSLTISVVVMVISSLFIMIDVKRVIDGGETTAGGSK